ncbi:DNA mismatch repair protein MutS [Aureimonas fodinaquatilis]|uniref:DNA mismatch repair protein MutS n=1 Tax=Aureimonas fodinaquatilis TaxID=2565783 RepID=A0A5B0DN95_9HYPH|nr:Smr/MutS family protein [Aureimonas fodinaquatilis]KAA0968254.1 DNA mismatch repair protein MutS [Aureimonas fodinaquatilis]
MKRRRLLSGEEKQLWVSVARTATPLRGKTLPELAAEVATDFAEAVSQPVSAKVSPAVPDPSPVKKPGKLPLNLIDRPVRRKLGKGRISIDDRIDLHGKTEAVAHYALLNFLTAAHAAGTRHVLVITGRGSSLGSQGALRRALPHWLATDMFRRLVSGYETAARGHGGDGAFYLRLRRS